MIPFFFSYDRITQQARVCLGSVSGSLPQGALAADPEESGRIAFEMQGEMRARGQPPVLFILGATHAAVNPPRGDLPFRVNPL